MEEYSGVGIYLPKYTVPKAEKTFLRSHFSVIFTFQFCSPFFVIDLLSPSASYSCGVAGGVEILVGEAGLSVLCMSRKLGSDQMI